jgi:hypothetical protein
VSSRVDLRLDVAVSPERAFETLTDPRAMSEWSGTNVRIIAGPSSPIDRGSVRRIEARGLKIDEEVISCDRPRRFAYVLAGGVPLDHHYGEILVMPNAGGARIEWSIRLGSRIPGLALVVRGLLARELRRGLARAFAA